MTKETEEALAATASRCGYVPDQEPAEPRRLVPALAL
jgi:hypothetical protein